MKNWIIGVLVVLVLGWAVWDFVIKDTEQKENKSAQTEETNNNENAAEVGLERGNQAPDFTLENLDGEEMKLSDFQGKKVLLNFWASWCGPCRAEMPDMQKYYEEYSDEVEIVAVNVRSTERNDEVVDEFLEEYGATFVVLSDVDNLVSDIFDAYQLPTSYLINTDGIIENRAIGPLTYDAMVREFDNMD
ncbi:MAG TPA: redoxin domain-containing protein [Pseudogracilibacillus sp.]|nr:redoxin domain-containing protein [Pseudogracilibacillus sp.]